MQKLWLIIGATLIVACGKTEGPVVVDTAQAAAGSTVTIADPVIKKSGIDLENIDEGIRPQDNFFRYANGAWLDQNEIPPDEVAYGAAIEVRDRNQERLKIVLEEAALADAEPGSDLQKIGDFYTSYMDEARANELGLEPLKAELELIAAAETYSDLARLFGRNMWLQLGVPFDYYVDRDRGDTSHHLF